MPADKPLPEPNQPSLLRRLTTGWEARDVAPVVSLLVLVIFFSFTARGFLSINTVTRILEQGAVLAIAAAGLTFVLLCAEIDLSVGSMAVWSACLCGWLFVHGGRFFENIGWPIGLAVILAIIAAPLCCLLLGTISGVLTVWSRLPSFIISLAMMFIALGLALFLLSGVTYKVPGSLNALGNEGLPVFFFLQYIPGDLAGLQAFIRFEFPYSAMLAAVVLLLGHVVLRYTRFGRYVYMTGGNREAARLAGVRTEWIVIACLAICAVTAALGGLVNAGRLNEANTDQNTDLLLSAVACVVLGGTSLFGGEGSMGKTVIGVLTFTVLSAGLLLMEQINDLARDLLTGVVLMIALVINGVLAKRG